MTDKKITRKTSDMRNNNNESKGKNGGDGTTHQTDGLALHLPRLLRGRGHRQTVPGAGVVGPLAELAQSSEEQEGVLMLDGREGLHRRGFPLSPVVAAQRTPACSRRGGGREGSTPQENEQEN